MCERWLLLIEAFGLNARLPAAPMGKWQVPDHAGDKRQNLELRVGVRLPPVFVEAKRQFGLVNKSFL